MTSERVSSRPTTSTTLVVGATGLLGRAICGQLRSANHPVRALVRPVDRSDGSSAVVDSLKASGVEIVSGDLTDPASLARACARASAVVSTASSMPMLRAGDTIEAVDRRGQLSLVEAARHAGVGHFVYVSFPELAGEFPLQRAKREVERALEASGMPYTILRPTFFMEVWLYELVATVARRETTLTTVGEGQGRIPFVAIDDVARSVVAALNNPAAHGLTLEIAGREALTQHDVIRLIAERLRSLGLMGAAESPRILHSAPEQLPGVLDQAHPEVLLSFRALRANFAAGDTTRGDRAATVLGVTPQTTVQMFIENVLTKTDAE